MTETYHKLVKAGVVAPQKNMRYWVDAKGDLYSTDTSSADYAAAIKLKSDNRTKKRNDKISKAVKIKAARKAKQLAVLDAKKAKILNS